MSRDWRARMFCRFLLDRMWKAVEAREMWLFWTSHYNQRVHDTTRSSTYGHFRTGLSVLVLGLNIGYNQQSIFRIKSDISSVPDHGCQQYNCLNTLKRAGVYGNLRL